jgi:hypothetical protein
MWRVLRHAMFRMRHNDVVFIVHVQFHRQAKLAAIASPYPAKTNKRILSAAPFPLGTGFATLLSVTAYSYAQKVY